MWRILLTVALALLPGLAQASTWSGLLENGTTEFTYSGDLPVGSTIDISFGPFTGVSQPCNQARQLDCGGVAQWEVDGRVSIISGGNIGQLWPPLLDSYCDDADACSANHLTSEGYPYITANTFVLSVEADGSCGVIGDTNTIYGPVSCDGFLPPTALNVTINLNGGGILTEVPLPSALPLFAAGLFLLGMLIVKRRQSSPCI